MAKKIPDKLFINDGETISKGRAAALPPSEASNVWYVGDDGERVFPFADPRAGEAFGLGDLADQQPRMRRLALTKIGWTDDKLEKERTRLFGKLKKGEIALSSGIDDEIEVQERRRRVFDDVTRTLMRAT